MTPDNDAWVVLSDDEPPCDVAPAYAGPPWRILIVDDEVQVHDATRFALREALVLGRPLHFESAYSAAEAREMLAASQYACVLLDVVMESQDAGLRLIRYIREDLADAAVRIVLRTGQPGYAPELDVVQKYDINDYKCKSELTANRLLTSLIAALRAYEQILTIESSRRGLEDVLRAASELLAVRAADAFAAGVLAQLCRLVRAPLAGMVVVRGPGELATAARVLYGAERFALSAGETLADCTDVEALGDVSAALARRSSLYEPDRLALFTATPQAREIVVWVPIIAPLTELDRKLLEVFAINVAVGFDNASFFEALESVAFVDGLTGLPNRSAFEAELGRQIGEHAAVAVAIADIDNFQEVNDGLGHEIGDKTIEASARLLREVFGKDTFVARASGDSFALLLPGCERDEIDARMRGLHARTRADLQIDGHEIPLSMSVGIALCPEHGRSATALFQNAGIALKQAKRVNRSAWEFFDNRLEQSLQTRLVVMRDLRHVIERGGLSLLYQPQVNLGSGQLFGVEALVRWRRDGVLVPAQDFIPAAEDSGHIVAIGEWVLREACRQQLRWRAEAALDLQMAVNVSMRQLKDAGFVDMLRRVLAETGLEPSRLELEITESLMVENATVLIDLLEQVRALGVRVAIDDFGTGYSSLSSLQKLPIDRLKIDRAFITGLASRKEDAVIVALVVNMGHLLDLEVIAEGVETVEQAERLVAMGCDDGQGYFYGRPMVASDIVRVAQSRS
ncbi:MAG: EAL domain-containing protein [Rhodocyclaceae bacterium]